MDAWNPKPSTPMVPGAGGLWWRDGGWAGRMGGWAGKGVRQSGGMGESLGWRGLQLRQNLPRLEIGAGNERRLLMEKEL